MSFDALGPPADEVSGFVSEPDGLGVVDRPGHTGEVLERTEPIVPRQSSATRRDRVGALPTRSPPSAIRPRPQRLAMQAGAAVR